MTSSPSPFNNKSVNLSLNLSIWCGFMVFSEEQPRLLPRSGHRVRSGLLQPVAVRILLYGLEQKRSGAGRAVQDPRSELCLLLHQALQGPGASYDGTPSCLQTVVAGARTEYTRNQVHVQVFLCIPWFVTRQTCSTEDSKDWLHKDGRMTCKILKESMVMLVENLHMRNGDAVPFPCFSAQFSAAVCSCLGDVFSQQMVVWSEAFVWCSGCFELLLDQTPGVATKLSIISNCWYANFNTLHVLSLEILDLYFQPMVFAAQCWKCQNWGNLLSVSLWSQVNIYASTLPKQFCSHTANNICGQRRSWNCLYACKTINWGNGISVPDHLFMCSKGTMFYLPDDQLVEDAVLLPFGFFHQRWTTTRLSMIPRFNGRNSFRLGSVTVHQNLQLNPPQPRVHKPDRTSGEPPAGHQPVLSTKEALKDCRCSNIESVLSTDERLLFGFICNLWYRLQVFRSSFIQTVQLGTFSFRWMLSHRDMLYLYSKL